MELTIFCKKFGFLLLVFGGLTVIFLNNVRCDVEGIVDLQYEADDDLEKHPQDHESEAERRDNIEGDNYDPHNPRHTRLYSGEVYKQMFAKYRLNQHEATKAVIKFGDYEKRYKLVSRMLNKLFYTLDEVKENATRFELVAGDLFPDVEEERTSISHIFENVFLFGDLMLRLPEMVHSIFDRHDSWRYLIGWALQWCEQSKFFDGPAKVILEIISQEAYITPRDDDWKPDYTNMTEVELDLVKTFYVNHVLKTTLDKGKKLAEEKKQKRQIKKGPRMSREDL